MINNNMDLFTEKANNIIKKLDENKTEHIVYSSEEDEMPEEDAETATALTQDDRKAGLDDQTMAAINLAQKMSTGAARSSFRQDPQKAMNQAYGKLMTGLANKLSKIKI